VKEEREMAAARAILYGEC